MGTSACYAASTPTVGRAVPYHVSNPVRSVSFEMGSFEGSSSDDEVRPPRRIAPLEDFDEPNHANARPNGRLLVTSRVPTCFQDGEILTQIRKDAQAKRD